MQALPQAVEPADAAKVCFTAAYTVVFLQQALSLGLDDRRVLFANSLALGGQQRVHLDWPLGAALQFLVGADAAAEDSAREVDDGGAAVLPMPGGDPAPSTPWEIRAVAFWLLMVALLMVTLTWVRCVCSAARLHNMLATMHVWVQVVLCPLMHSGGCGHVWVDASVPERLGSSYFGR